MSGEVTITATSSPPWTAALAAATNPATLRAGLAAACLELLREVRKYPAPNRLTRASVYGQTFASDKQRRWFFASLHDGSLTLPYRRSRNLGQSWAYEVRTPTLAIIGTNVGYARLVKDEGNQSAYLAAVGWPTVQDDAAKAETRVRAALDQAIRLALGIR
jgi:hypothetical protein